MEKDSRANAYALSLLFMDYLTREYGSGFIPRFVAELASDVKPQDAVKAVTGRDFAQLQDSFSAELETVY
jgi:hypothetical protein